MTDPLMRLAEEIRAKSAELEQRAMQGDLVTQKQEVEIYKSILTQHLQSEPRIGMNFCGLDTPDKQEVGNFGIKVPLAEIYENIDKMITEFQESVKEYRWESPKADDSCRTIWVLGDRLACDIQAIFKQFHPHIPQLNLFKPNTEIEPIGEVVNGSGIYKGYTGNIYSQQSIDTLQQERDELKKQNKTQGESIATLMTSDMDSRVMLLKFDVGALQSQNAKYVEALEKVRGKIVGTDKYTLADALDDIQTILIPQPDSKENDDGR